MAQDRPADRLLRSPLLRDLHDYWQAARGARPMPFRKDVNPMAIRPILPHLIFVDVEHDPPAFRFRIVGSAVVSLVGRDVSGRYADKSLFGARLEDVLGAYRLAVEHAAPVGKRGKARWITGREWLPVEQLVLPLTVHGTRADMLINAMMRADAPIGDKEGVRIFLDPVFAAP
jgi:hypothetical protein